ncbi:MAG: Na(+)/H(+) antiporter subunit E [Candidatus Omnitrophica bacterium]|nr:Na(+)/H(+) antiporter subunit E [Candidatus Omnitrophota bacterium]
MRKLSYNILLAVIWAAMAGSFEPPVLVTGALLGYAVLRICRAPKGGRHFRSVRSTIAYALFVAWELWLSSVQVAHDVITTAKRNTPGVVAVPLEPLSDMQIFILANSITLTPGTMTLDVSSDRRTLYIHGMFVKDPAAFRKGLKENFERRVMELMR